MLRTWDRVCNWTRLQFQQCCSAAAVAAARSLQLQWSPKLTGALRYIGTAAHPTSRALHAPATAGHCCSCTAAANDDDACFYRAGRKIPPGLFIAASAAAEAEQAQAGDQCPAQHAHRHPVLLQGCPHINQAVTQHGLLMRRLSICSLPWQLRLCKTRPTAKQAAILWPSDTYITPLWPAPSNEYQAPSATFFI